MERVSLARHPEMTVEQARRKATEIIGKIAEGNNPAEARRALKGELSFSDLFEEYAARHGKKKKSWRDDSQRYRDYLEKPLGKYRLSEIDTPLISRVLGTIERSGKSGALFNGVRALASVLFSKGIEYGYVATNPVSSIRLKPVIKRDRFLQGHELPRFFKALSDEPNSTVRDYFWISLLTGARRANVLAMRWSEINFEDSIWRIPVTKNGDPQNVTLTAEAIEILMARQRTKASESNFVFPGEGKSGHLVEPKRGWQRIFDRDELTQLTEAIKAAGGKFRPIKSSKAGSEVNEPIEARLTRAREAAKQLGIDVENIRIADIRIHDLRRTLGSWQAKTGASLSIIGKSLNQKSHQATAIYARLDLDPIRASVEKATSAMLDAGGIKDVTPLAISDHVE